MGVFYHKPGLDAAIAGANAKWSHGGILWYNPLVFDLESLDILLSGSFGRVAAALWGACWGSFFNVLIVRLPARESVVRPASHCRVCKEMIAWYDNIPILSYLLLRGQCRHCHTRFSPRYALTEALVCALTVLMHHLFVASATGPIGLRLAQFFITFLFCGILVSLAFIDLDTMRIPDKITYPGIPAAAALSLFMDLPHFWDGMVGAVAGYLVIRIIADGYQLLTGRMGMGYGDAKLLAMIGGLLGWQVLLPTLFLASFQGSVIGITALVIIRRGKIDAEAEANPAPVPENVQPAADFQAGRRTGQEAGPSQAEADAEAEADADAEAVAVAVADTGARTGTDTDTDAEEPIEEDTEASAAKHTENHVP